MKAALERHSRKCIICHHPEREAIEEEFLHWRAPWKLAEDYNLADYRTIYRHARAAGLLLQRRENLHSGLDAFVEAVDDVKFTGDTILRAMRAYSCIDRHGCWTEIPTRVSISTFRDPGDDDPDNDAPADEENEEEHSEPASRSDATACAVPPAQALPRDAGRGQNLKDRSPSGRTDCAVSPAQPASTVSLNPHHRSRSETAPACADPPAQVTPRNTVRGHNPQSRSVSEHTACAASPAQDSGRDAAAVDDPHEPDNDPDTELEELEDEVLEEHATAYAASLAQAVEKLTAGSNHRGRSVTATACAALPRTSRGSPAQAPAARPRNAARRHNPKGRSEPDRTTCADPSAQDSAHAAPQPRAAQYSNPASRSESTACAAPPAQATPRNAVRGHNPQSCSVSEHTACAASPAQPAPHAHAWQNPLPPPAPLTDYPPVYPIYGPAIRNERKTQRFSKLRFSNRR
jgi:hypothetical protein